MVENFNGQKLNVSARRYVVALGAIENARILLNANRQMSQGIGNGKGWVGRCFMEHLNVPIGRFIVTDTQFWQKETALVPTAEFLRQSNIGNGIVSLGPNSSPQSYGRLRVLKQFARETGCALPRMAEVMRQVVDFDCPGDGLVTSLIEQSPNPDSRVSLINDTDKFGLRRIQLNWNVNARDKKTIRLLAIKTAEEMARLDLARVQLAPFITNPNLDIEVGAHAHHMGTTRMAATPDFGVVNENCQVFGVEESIYRWQFDFPHRRRHQSDAHDSEACSSLGGVSGFARLVAFVIAKLPSNISAAFSQYPSGHGVADTTVEEASPFGPTLINPRRQHSSRKFLAIAANAIVGPDR
ncbi:GMC oxidoreductase [Bradyrhizobium sp. RDT10]